MTSASSSLATFAGGCFWCTEAAFVQLAGVLSVRPGYMGGDDPAPTYEKVCGGRTGHAEVVEVEFDPAVIDYATLLEVFFTIHDPTTLNRQGHDVGTQYRSAIFFHDEAQRAEAAAVIERLNAEGYWGAPIVTELVPTATFHVAEAYHHQYFRNNPYQGYCMAVVAPKAAKVRQLFAGRCHADA
jgi:peptide-methionine (S)-S-oxide reductase